MKLQTFKFIWQLHRYYILVKMFVGGVKTYRKNFFWKLFVRVCYIWNLHLMKMEAFWQRVSSHRVRYFMIGQEKFPSTFFHYIFRPFPFQMTFMNGNCERKETPSCIKWHFVFRFLFSVLFCNETLSFVQVIRRLIRLVNR